MRRDYFSCVFLLCVCAALFFVCFEPIYFSYGSVIPRTFTLQELIFSSIYAVSVLLIIPVYAAYRKRIWITWGLAFYGLFIMLPNWIVPGIADKVAGDDASLGLTVVNFLLRSIYSMAHAPFAALSMSLGDSKAVNLPNWILPISIGTYVLCQLYRFYRDAYVAEQLDPKSIMDKTAAENQKPATEDKNAPKPEILGTVISAPVKAVKPVATPAVRKVNLADVPTDATIRMAPKPSQLDAPEEKAQLTGKDPNAQLKIDGKKPEDTPKFDAKEKPMALPVGEQAVINLGAPPKTPGDDVIIMGAPEKKSDVIIMEAPKPTTPDTPFDDKGAIRL